MIRGGYNGSPYHSGVLNRFVLFALAVVARPPAVPFWPIYRHWFTPLLRLIRTFYFTFRLANITPFERKVRFGNVRKPFHLWFVVTVGLYVRTLPLIYPSSPNNLNGGHKTKVGAGKWFSVSVIFRNASVSQAKSKVK